MAWQGVTVRFFLYYVLPAVVGAAIGLFFVTAWYGDVEFTTYKRGFNACLYEGLVLDVTPQDYFFIMRYPEAALEVSGNDSRVQGFHKGLACCTFARNVTGVNDTWYKCVDPRNYSDTQFIGIGGKII